jgi:peptidyl-prolyl cis-trans isomerase C
MNRIIQIVSREPLIPLIVCGCILYWLYSTLSPEKKEIIEIKPEVIQALVTQQEELTGKKQTEEDRKRILQSHIDDEVLLREAYKRGFDRSDFRVRNRLLSVMRYTLTENVPSPSVAQLQQFFEENKEKYMNPESITFDHVFFSHTSDKMPENLNEYLQTVKEADDPSVLGDLFYSGNRENKITREYLVGRFGLGFAKAVFDHELNQWIGPVESKYGIHYVQVVERHPPSLPEFEAVESYLRQEYEFAKIREIQNVKIDEMKQNYSIRLSNEISTES